MVYCRRQGREFYCTTGTKIFKTGTTTWSNIDQVYGKVGNCYLQVSYILLKYELL